MTDTTLPTRAPCSAGHGRKCMRAMGIYREAEFSPGKVGADAGIMDEVMAELRDAGVSTSAIDPDRLSADPRVLPDVVLAMCQSEKALRALAALEQAGAVVINSALAIRNCYRDLMGAGLARAGVPSPRGALIDATASPQSWKLDRIEPSRGVWVKRGDLHALDSGDVRRVDGQAALEAAVADFADRGVRYVYVQQDVAGRVIKFYGVSGGEYFAALDDDGALSDAVQRRLRHCAERAAIALGLEAWGGDAVLAGNDVMIIDFNDWPSYGRVRKDAARAIARRCLMLVRRPRRIASAVTALSHQHEDDDS